MEIRDKQETFFGWLDPLVVEDGNVVKELAYFHSSGRSHTHDKWENCCIIYGKGKIIIDHDNKPQEVYLVGGHGDVSIPPNTRHWMEVDTEMMIVLEYSNTKMW